nr:hypothetical protein [Tanacetum cinerariifolium]
DNSLLLEKAKDKGIVDSGCSQSMSGNKDKLEDFEDFDGGEVTFGGSIGKISGKGTIKTKTLNFENVLYVKELQHFNLISVSQICDQTHRVLFTKNECLVLSKDFPLPDPSMVILSIPRKHNLYTFSLNELALKVKAIRCDNGTEFKNANLIEFCGSKGIRRDYSNARTLQQNGVAERKNRTLIEAPRTMLADSLLPTIFWSEAVATACYVLNRVLVTKPHHKTLYELLTGDKPSISYLKPFGCQVTILNTSDPLGKFDKKSDKGYIIRYSISSKAYRVYNLVSRKIEETMNLKFLKNKPFVAGTGQAWMFDIDYLTDSLNNSRVSSTNLTAGSQVATPSDAATTQNDGTKSDHATTNADNLDELTELQALQRQEQAGKEEADQLRLAFPSLNPILGVDIHDGLKLFDCPKSGIFTSSSYDEEFSGPDANNLESSLDVRSTITKRIHNIHPTSQRRNNHPDFQLCMFSCFLSQEEPITVAQALADPNWGIVCKNKARLVAQGHRHEEGIDYTDVFALVARIEAIRLFLAFASFIGFKVYQMDVKSAFLYGKIAEEVYVTQPRGFEDPDHPKKIYKVVKALYGLHQAPRAWYERLSIFLLKHRYRRGTIDKTLFIKKDSKDIMLSEFEMSSMGPLTFFLGLQVDQRPDGIFIYQEKYVADILKNFDLDNSKLASTPFEPQKIREKNVPDEPISVHLYRSMIGCLMYLTATRPDIMFAVCAATWHQVTPMTSNLLSVNDYVGAHGDMKSTTGGCRFLRRRLISWQCKKQTIVAISSCEAEYVAAASCCGQWFLFTSAGRVTFCWLFLIPTGWNGFCWWSFISAGSSDFYSLLLGSASEVSLPDGVKGLVAIIDGTVYTVTEASIRSALYRTKFLMYPRFLQIILDTDTEDTTPYPTPLVTKKFFATMRHYQGPDMPLLAHMLNRGEPDFVQAQQQEVSLPPPSPMVAQHPLPDPMPSPPRQSSPPPIPFGPTPSSGVVSTEPILDIPYSSGPSEPVLETITSPVRDDDTGGGSFHESLPRPPPATPPRSPTRIDTLEAKLKATRILHRDTVVLFAKRIKKLESKLKSKKRILVLSNSENEEEARQSQELDALLDLANAALHEPSDSTTPSKPTNQAQSSEQEISPTTLDAVLTLSQSKARARAATIIYKRLKKQQSSSGLDFTNAATPDGGMDSAGGLDSAGGVDSAGGLVSAGGLDSAGGLPSAGILVAAGPTVPAEHSSLIRDLSKGKAVATPSSPVSSPTAKELADQQATILEAERQELLKQKLKQSLDAEQVYLDSWTWKDVRDLTDDQLQIVYDKIRRVVDLATDKDHHQHLKRSGETLESSESKKLKISYSTTQPTELQETTFVFAGTTIAAGDPIPVVTSVSAASSISAATLNTAGVSTTAGASGSASEASVPIIELLDSSLKDTSLPLDPESEAQDATLRKYSKKKSIARRRTLPSAYKPTYDALLFNEDDPEAEFKRYLRQASDDDEPVEPVSLALVSDITSWEILPTEFGLGEIHVLTRADGTIKRFSNLRELMYWAGIADLMVLYGLVLDKYKAERATAGDIMYMFVDKKYPLTPETIQRMLNLGLEIDRDPSGFDILHKSLSRSFTCKSILPPQKQARKIYYWDLTRSIRACRELLKRRIYRSDLKPFLINSKVKPNLISLSKMSDHEEETINEENGHPKVVPQITTVTNISAKFPYLKKGKEEKARTILLSALPDEHMGDFYHMIYARDIWNAIKARFEEGLDKGYAKMQKILTQMNSLKIKPDPKYVNMKFLRGLPPYWSGYSSSSSTLSNAAFVSTAGSSQGNLSYQESGNSDYATFPGSSSSKGSSKSKCSVVDNVIYSFFENHEIDQHLVYEDLDQMNKEDFKEYDLKHQMSMLSIKVHRFEKKHRQKIKFTSRENARFDKKLVKCFNCKQMGHFSRECRAQGGQNSNNYQKYKSKEAGKDGSDSKAMVVVDGSIDWDKQTEGGNIEPRSLENFGMIAGIKVESDADSEGEVVSADDAILAG